MKKMQSKLKSVDCIIEVHDARVSLIYKLVLRVHSFIYVLVIKHVFPEIMIFNVIIFLVTKV